MKGAGISPDGLKEKLTSASFETLRTRFLNQDAMISMLNFGKGEIDDLQDIEVNQELELKLFHYYKAGNWEFY